MTLILVATSPRAIYIASDYRLTSSAGPGHAETMMGLKQFGFTATATNNRFVTGHIAFTGFTKQGAVSTREWLTNSIQQLPKDVDPNELPNHVRNSLNDLISKVPIPHRRLTVVLVGQISQAATVKT